MSQVRDHMQALACAYQRERPDLEEGNVGRLVVQGLCVCATSATIATSATRLGTPSELDFCPF